MGTDPIRDEQIAQLILRELNLILDSANDWRLGLLKIVAVIPTAGGAHYTVMFAPAEGWSAEDDPNTWDGEPQELLQRARGYLRSELMESLNLRRMPELTFIPVPPSWNESLTK